MGIRLKKVLGYGLTDLVSDNCRIADPRVRVDDDEFEDILNKKVSEYAEFIDARIDELKTEQEGLEGDEKWAIRSREMDLSLVRMGLNDENKKERLYNLITYSPEYGLDNVLVFTPAGMSDWKRSGDSIDYAELIGVENYQEDTVKICEGGLYPWESLWIDKRDSRVINPYKAVSLRRDQDFDLGTNAKNIAWKDSIAKSCGFNSFPEAKANMIPGVPEAIKTFNDFTGILTPEGLLDLRPVLYNYWS